MFFVFHAEANAAQLFTNCASVSRVSLLPLLLLIFSGTTYLISLC